MGVGEGKRTSQEGICSMRWFAMKITKRAKRMAGHEKNDDEDGLWSHAKATIRLELVLLVATLDVLGPAAIMIKR